jgi:hypothetical protein
MGYASPDPVSEIGKSLRKQQKEQQKQIKQENHGKPTLSIYDYKKFKFMKDVSSRYKFGKTLG